MIRLSRSNRILVLMFLHFLESACNGYDPEASITGLYTGPYFDPLAERNLTAHLGDRAVLPCTVRQLGDKSVSWVRKRDADILTVDRYTFVSDERFEAQYSEPHETWNLVIMYVQERDAGLYECQVSTEPKMSQLFNLRVVVPRVTMIPHGDRYVKEGSTVEIDCKITDVVQQPDYIFWYHQETRILEQQDPNIEVIVKDTGPESMMSTLTIKSVREKESGNYTCTPSNLYSASAHLHVLEEHRAAMHSGVNPATKNAPHNHLIIYFILILVCFQYGKRIILFYNKPESKNGEPDPSKSNLGPLLIFPSKFNEVSEKALILSLYSALSKQQSFAFKAIESESKESVTMKGTFPISIASRAQEAFAVQFLNEVRVSPHLITESGLDLDRQSLGKYFTINASIRKAKDELQIKPCTLDELCASSQGQNSPTSPSTPTTVSLLNSTLNRPFLLGR